MESGLEKDLYKILVMLYCLYSWYINEHSLLCYLTKTLSREPVKMHFT